MKHQRGIYVVMDCVPFRAGSDGYLRGRRSLAGRGLAVVRRAVPFGSNVDGWTTTVLPTRSGIAICP